MRVCVAKLLLEKLSVFVGLPNLCEKDFLKIPSVRSEQDKLYFALIILGKAFLAIGIQRRADHCTPNSDQICLKDIDTLRKTCLLLVRSSR